MYDWGVGVLGQGGLWSACSFILLLIIIVLLFLVALAFASILLVGLVSTWIDACQTSETLTLVSLIAIVIGAYLLYTSWCAPSRPDDDAFSIWSMNPLRWSSDRMGEPPAAGVVGLRNLGNSCYMGATLQCLSHVPELTSYVVSDEYASDVRPENRLGTGGKVIEAYAELLKKVWSGKYVVVSPSSFKDVVGKHHGLFSGWEQQDAQEFLGTLLDSLHEDVNGGSILSGEGEEKKKEEEDEEEEVDGDDEWGGVELRGRRMMEGHRERNRSIVTELMCGAMSSTLKCGSCGRLTGRVEPFTSLPLPVPAVVLDLDLTVLGEVPVGGEAAMADLAGARPGPAAQLPAGSMVRVSVAATALWSDVLREVRRSMGLSPGAVELLIFRACRGEVVELIPAHTPLRLARDVREIAVQALTPLRGSTAEGDPPPDTQVVAVEHETVVFRAPRTGSRWRLEPCARGLPILLRVSSAATLSETAAAAAQASMRMLTKLQKPSSSKTPSSLSTQKIVPISREERRRLPKGGAFRRSFSNVTAPLQSADSSGERGGLPKGTEAIVVRYWTPESARSIGERAAAALDDARQRVVVERREALDEAARSATHRRLALRAAAEAERNYADLRERFRLSPLPPSLDPDSAPMHLSTDDRAELLATAAAAVGARVAADRIVVEDDAIADVPSDVDADELESAARSALPAEIGDEFTESILFLPPTTTTVTPSTTSTSSSTTYFCPSPPTPLTSSSLSPPTPTALAFDPSVECGLSHCMAMATHTESLEGVQWTCPHCRHTSVPLKQQLFWETPDILVLVLKRFQNDPVTAETLKNTRPVHIPATLDLRPYIHPAAPPSDPVYRLQSVVQHFGSLTRGHYTAVAQAASDNSWWSFNDDIVRPLSSASADNSIEDDIDKVAAYVLFYRKSSTMSRASHTASLLSSPTSTDPSSPRPATPTSHRTARRRGAPLPPTTKTDHPRSPTPTRS